MNLLEGTEQIVETLGSFPAIGPVEAERPGAVLRSVRYSKWPYVAWYSYDPTDPEGDIWLVRLFHARQLRPRPDLARWLRRRSPS